MNNFGTLPISDYQNNVISRLLEKFAEYRYNPDDPAFFSTIDVENGILTSNQWDIVDFLSAEDKPTIMELAKKLDKKSISSIQKPRDMATRKFIEAIITVSYLLQDENYFRYFLSEVLE